MSCIGSPGYAPRPSPPAATSPEETIDSSLMQAYPAGADAYPPVDPVLLHCASWARELGVRAVSPAAGAVLRLLAGAAGARAVVEFGTGTGVSGLWLLAGMPPDGVLTSVDTDPDHQALARQSFAAAGHPPARVRLIEGAALDVATRLTDGAYDLVFVDGDPYDHARCVGAARRLLRPGGVLVLALSEPAASNEEHFAVRELVTAVRDAPEWTATLVPVGTGLLCATLAVASQPLRDDRA